MLAISASPRRGGNSEVLCDEFLRGAAERGHAVEKLRLAEKRSAPCLACSACADSHDCVRKDDMAEVLAALKAADVIVLASPVYFYHVAAVALRGFRIAAVSFIMMAYDIFASGWFTALNNGKTSAILSFCRTIVFMVVPVLFLPRLFGMDGVWLSLAAGEVLSMAMSNYYFGKYRTMWRRPGAEPAVV